MKKVLNLLILLAIAMAAPKRQALNSNAKADELRELQLNSKDRIIQLNSTGYFYYTMEFPRSYDVVIYFTAPNCKLCQDLYDEYKLVANFYIDAGSMYASKEDNGAKRPVFFATITYNENNKQVFSQVGFNSVPNLFVSQPKIVVVPQEERSLYLREYKWSITHTDGHVTSHKLLEYINKRTTRNIEYKPKITEVFLMIGVLAGVVALAVLLFRGFKTIFNNPRLWFAGSCAIYIICMGGLVHNIIHNVPFTNVDANGNVEWKTSGGRQQLGAEGFVMSVCITSVGISMILYHKILQAKTITQDKSILNLSYICLFAVTIILISFIEQTYKEKSWYDPKFWPPAHYIKGPLMRDQGNTI